MREAVVTELFRATVDERLSDEHLAELLWNASPTERRAVADLHHEAMLGYLRRAVAMREAMIELAAWWQTRAYRRMADFTLGRALKACPPGMADKIVADLHDAGWSAADGLPPRPGGVGDGD